MEPLAQTQNQFYQVILKEIKNKEKKHSSLHWELQEIPHISMEIGILRSIQFYDETSKENFLLK